MLITKCDKSELGAKIDTLLKSDAAEKLGVAEDAYVSLGFALIDSGVVRGGVTGALTLQGFHIGALALDKDLRQQGHGTKLMKAIEREAIRLGAKVLTVSTQGFQALGFYEKLDYEVFATLDDWPIAGETKYYLKKIVTENDGCQAS
ncbi:MAG: GNAT family N-acetyltransferase [Promicromonosporaceae bacterium]|nr:GNAT family N-acetyltransferase [Promicromonosporaceae bacterium]